MAARVQLTRQDNFYYVFTYPNSEENSSFQTCFPYANREQEKVLKKARDFAEARAKDLGVKLEENLDNTQNNA